MAASSGVHAASVSRREWLAAERARSRAHRASLLVLVPHAVARGLALFLGLFALVNLVGELRTPGFDQNIWWVDLRPVPALAGALLLGVVGALLTAWAVRPAAAVWRRCATAAAAAGLTAAALWNSVTFYRVWLAGDIVPWSPVPLSLVIAGALALVLWAVLRPSAPGGRLAWPLLVLTVLVCGISFPLLQIAFFGATDYRRHVDAAVVFGAEVHADGRASTALADRVRTAVTMYRQGLADRLVMSGGVGESGFDEAQVMRDLAVQQGVPAEHVVVDSAGVNTDATVRNTLPLLQREGGRGVAVVTHFYHLPRVKLAYQRQGLDVVTVPARQSYIIPQTPRLVAREVPAFWVYYLRAVLR